MMVRLRLSPVRKGEGKRAAVSRGVSVTVWADVVVEGQQSRLTSLVGHAPAQGNGWFCPIEIFMGKTAERMESSKCRYVPKVPAIDLVDRVHCIHGLRRLAIDTSSQTQPLFQVAPLHLEPALHQQNLGSLGGVARLRVRAEFRGG